MKKNLRYILIGIVLGGLVGLASSARAQFTDAELRAIADGEGTSVDDIKTNLQGDTEKIWESRYRSTYLPPTQTERQEQEERAEASRQRAEKEKAAAERAKDDDPDSALPCSWRRPSTWPGCFAAKIANLALLISSRLLWIAGILLNLTLHYTLNMSTLLASLPIVDIGWTIIRDIANITFIFIALWSGIAITLGIRAEKAWGLLAQMVLVALFINFSLFITKAVVDASNVAALHFYSLIRQPAEPGKEAFDGGLSDAFMAGLNVQSLYNTSQLEKLSGGEDKYVRAVGRETAFSFVNVMLIGVFGSFFMITAGWVFLMAALMFIYRAVVLIMLMILSPLAFVAWLLPGASGLATKWWSTLWSQSFFAPLYLALAYVVVRTINSETFQGLAVAGEGPTSFAAAFTGFNSASVIIVLNFIILIGLMVGCLIIAQQLGAKGSEMAMAGWQKIKGESVSFLGRTAMRGFGLGAIGEGLRGKLEEGKVPRPLRLLTRIGATALKYTSVRNIDERLSQTKLGNLGMVKFLREQTLGRLRHAKFGGAKSAEEAYEESERDASVRRKIGYLAEARRAGGEMRRLRGLQGARYTARFAAQSGLAQEQQRVSETMTPQVTPQQQQEIQQRERDLNTARAVSPQQHAQITQAEQALAQAQQDLASDPNNRIFQQMVQTAEQRLNTARAVSPQQHAQITQAEQALAQAQAPRWTPEQQQIQAALGALAQAEQNLAANPNDPALIAARDAAENQLYQVSPAHRELAEAQRASEEAEANVNQFNSDYGQQIAEYTRRMSQFLAKLSPKEFLEYMPKPEFFNPALMSMEVLPTSFIDALMKDEHALTEPEKDAAYEARQHDIIEISKRGEDRWRWYHDAMQRFQRAVNDRDAASARIENQLMLPNGTTLHAELTNVEALRKQLARERALPQNQRNAQLIQTLEQNISARNQAVQALLRQRDAQIEQMMRRGELERPERPDQPGWEEAPELRRALRNMRGLTEISHWYQHARESLNLKHLAQTIMQGVWSDVRKSELFDSSFKEEVGRGLKREYVLFSGDLTMGFDPNVTDAVSQKQRFAMNELRKLANKRLTELGPDAYFAQFDQPWTDDDGHHGSIKEQYLALFRTSAAEFDERERARIEAEEQTMSNRERLDVRFKGGMAMYDQVSQNLASDEFTLMRGLERDLYVVMRNMEVSQLRHYASRDLDVKIPMVEFFLKQFSDEILGIRKMTAKNLQIFTWFVNQGGQDFIPWEQIRPELKDDWEQIKALIGRTDARTLPSIYDRLRNYAANPQDAPVMKRINELRAERGLPPLDASTQPFGRIGAVA